MGSLSCDVRDIDRLITRAMSMEDLPKVGLFVLTLSLRCTDFEASTFQLVCLHSSLGPGWSDGFSEVRTSFRRRHVHRQLASPC